MTQPHPKKAPPWLRTLFSCWYFPLIHIVLPACAPIRLARIRLPSPLQRIGNALSLLGAALTAWSMYHLVRDGKGTPAPNDPPVRLVSRGPYRYCRNPMELGNLLTMLGRVISEGNPRVLLASLFFAVGHHIWFMFIEEPGLRRRYGEAYVAYCARVPRWGWQSVDRHPVSATHPSRKVPRESVELSVEALPVIDVPAALDLAPIPKTRGVAETEAVLPTTSV